MARLNKYKHLVKDTLARVIQRPDELGEFVSMYWKDGKQPLSAQVKKGLALAFRKFNEYQLAKYNREKAVKLRDVLFLCHAKPRDAEQADLWKRLAKNELAVPDTWEVALSAGMDKKETWERLIRDRKLGGLAFLRNLRNMKDAGVAETIVFEGLQAIKTDRILPFRFISAAKHAPQWESHIEEAMLRCLNGKDKLSGKTAIVIDGSGSMFGTPVSRKSDIDRFEAAAALAILIREIAEACVVVVFSNNAYVVPSRRGFALRDALYKQAEQRGTHTQKGINVAALAGYNRLIVITDEQSHGSISNPVPGARAYIANVACERNGIGYGEFVHIAGWSESIVDYIQQFEQ
jgi:hypothetical protein